MTIFTKFCATKNIIVILTNVVYEISNEGGDNDMNELYLNYNNEIREVNVFMSFVEGSKMATSCLDGFLKKKKMKK